MNIVLKTKAQKCVDYFRHDQYGKLAKMTLHYSVAKMHELKEAVLELCISDPEKYKPSFLILDTNREDGQVIDLELEIASVLSKKWKQVEALNVDKKKELEEKKAEKAQKSKKKKKAADDYDDDFDDDFI